MITYKEARAVFNYRDGRLYWKISRGKVRVGAEAGYREGVRGRRIIMFNRKPYFMHRLVWLWHRGYLPEHGLDHIDRNTSNNRIENLREVSNQCNARNSGNYSTNTSGVKGVCWDKSPQRWKAYTQIYGKTYNLGKHKDFSEAVLMRLAAEQCLGWEGCDSSSPAYQYAVKHKLVKTNCNIAVG